VTTPTLPPQIPNDPRGWLTFSAPLPNELQNGEDSTAHHDFYGCEFTWSSEQTENGAWIDYFERPATATERTLLAELGYTLPDELVTRVSFPSRLVRRRRWPALETEGSTP
jgi:hypothetical protein